MTQSSTLPNDALCMLSYIGCPFGYHPIRPSRRIMGETVIHIAENPSVRMCNAMASALQWLEKNYPDDKWEDLKESKGARRIGYVAERAGCDIIASALFNWNKSTPLFLSDLCTESRKIRLIREADNVSLKWGVYGCVEAYPTNV
jgi:hypothetical protein